MKISHALQTMTALALLALLPMHVIPAQAKTTSRPLILVHYMPWFEARPFGRTWGWHWTMNAFDPDQADQTGQPSIASHYHPLIGPYDSADPAVIEYHLLLMKLASIDGIVIDWYGRSDLYDYPIIHRNTAALIQAAGRLGLKVAICYEDQTITRLVEAGKLSASQRVNHARGEMDWLRSHWFAEASYLKINGKPVLLSFGFDGLNDAEWGQVFTSTASAPLYLSEHRRRPGASGAFDWPVPQQGLGTLDAFYRTAKDWPVSMPVAFPRFHDIYKEARVGNSYGEIADQAGRTFSTTLGRALDSGAPIIQIATWNDWGEGTMIEPSMEFGTRDLETILRLRPLTGPASTVSPTDLLLPHRLYKLRKKHLNQPALTRELDRVAQLLASRLVPAARQALTRLES